MKKRILNGRLLPAALILLAILTVTALFAWLFVPILRFASEPESFRKWIDAHAVSGRLAYLGAVFLQVLVAVIPGEPLEIAGGYAFGAIEGTLLCLLAAVLGGLTVFLLVRRFGDRLVGLFFPPEKLHRLSFLQITAGSKKEFLFFVLFAIPGTPKDLLCYFAGLTDIRFSTWLLICSVGRLPSLITSTVGGSALGEQSYLLAILIFAMTLILSLLGLWSYNRICKLRERKSKKENDDEKRKSI